MVGAIGHEPSRKQNQRACMANTGNAGITANGDTRGNRHFTLFRPKIRPEMELEIAKNRKTVLVECKFHPKSQAHAET
jgi:hypothetical protein